LQVYQRRTTVSVVSAMRVVAVVAALERVIMKMTDVMLA
jgi:hypothetical protein